MLIMTWLDRLAGQRRKAHASDLLRAAEEADLGSVADLLARGAPIDATDIYGYTPLMRSIASKKPHDFWNEWV